MLIGRPSTSVSFSSNAFCACSGVSKSTYPKPFGRPVSRSVMIRAETTPPIDSKMLASHSWSMFQERLPTKMLVEPVASDSGFERLAGVSVADVGASALRFWPATAAGLASSSSPDSSSSDSSSSESSSEEDSSFAAFEPLDLAAALTGALVSSDSSSESSSELESSSESESESESSEEESLSSALGAGALGVARVFFFDSFGASSSEDSSDF